MWAGTINFAAGDHLLSVEYDSADTAAVLRARCAAWLVDDDRDVPAVFGVRAAKVGFRRRTVAVLHHGAPIRARLASVEAAADTIASFLAEIDVVADLHRSRPGLVAVDARAFLRDGEIVLLHAPPSSDADERQLRRLGISEVQTWRPRVDPATGTVTIGQRSWPLRGFVVVGLPDHGFDHLRQHVWQLGAPHEPGWANRVDSLGDRVAAGSHDIAQALEAAFR